MGENVQNDILTAWLIAAHFSCLQWLAVSVCQIKTARKSGRASENGSNSVGKRRRLDANQQSVKFNMDENENISNI